MNFFQLRNLSEARLNLQQLAELIAKDYLAGKDLADSYEIHSKGLDAQEQEELVRLVKEMVKAGKIKLRPGAYSADLQPYAPAHARPPQFSQEERRVLEILEPRVERRFMEYLYELYKGDPDLQALLADPESKLDMLREFLYEKYQIKVRDDGLIEFDYITKAVERIIGNLPVVVYHYTTTKLDKKIRQNGIQPYGQPGVKKVNAYQNTGAGVYVTTETGGKAVDQYRTMAVTKYGGNPRTWVIRTTLGQLEADPDDADLVGGKYQFVLPEVRPENLVAAE